MNATEVREEVLSWMNHVPPLDGCAIPSSGERGVVTGLMNSALKLDGTWEEANYRRRMVLAWIFRDLLGRPTASAISAKELTDEMWWSLIKWTEASKDQDSGKWEAHGGFDDEVVSCSRAIEAWEHDMNNQLMFLDVL